MRIYLYWEDHQRRMRGAGRVKFEWNENKRRSNAVKHDIDFQDAAEIFDGRHIVTFESQFRDEPRLLTTGELTERIITVVWTPRGNATRIISARRARKKESDAWRGR